MNTDKSIAWTLRIGIVAGIILIIIGEIMGEWNDALWLGILVLIMSPLLGIVVAFAGLLIEKDWFWASVTAILLTVVGAGLILALI